MKGQELSAQGLSSLHVAKVFNHNQKHVKSLDFDYSGKFLITSSEDESLRLYNCIDGIQQKYTPSKKYGCDLARFTHKSSNIIYASTKEDDTIRYLSFHDNKYLRYFKGHTNRVISLEISPHDDLFLSASKDATVRLWDLKTPDSVGKINIPSTSSSPVQPCVAWDPTGLVFAVASNNSTVRLYDSRNYQEGPFATAEIPKQTHSWHNIKFSNDSRNILVSTTGSSHLILDGSDAEYRFELDGFLNTAGFKLEGAFTPDSKFVVCGSQDGPIHFWNASNGEYVCGLPSHTEPTKVVAFNPKFYMLATADTNLAFWITPY